MKRVGKRAIIAAWLLIVCSLQAQDAVELLDNWKAPADTKEYPGQIIRPQISPADTTWVSFEIHNRSEVQLYLYNTVTLESRRIQSPSEAADDDDLGFTHTPIDRDLSWRPVKDGGIWAAFIGNGNGNDELYLYEVTSDKYYLLRSWSDSLGQTSKREPSWSPDGRCLTYTTTPAGNADIYIIRGMNFVIKNPDSEKAMQSHSPLITGDGDQFGAVWCPVPGAGYIAYNYIGDNKQKSEVRVYDPLTSRSFGITGGDEKKGNFAPSWEPGGKQIAYYQYDVSGTFFSSDLNPEGDKYGLSLATVTVSGDSLLIATQRGGRSGTQSEIIDVAPNLDRYRGPAWLPNGTHLLVPLYDEKARNPLKTVYPSEWAFSSPKKFWLGGFATGAFGYPRDVSIVDHSITFTFSEEQRRVLLVGQLKKDVNTFVPATFLEIESSRRTWWKGYSRRSSASFGQKIWSALMTPIGPDIGVNRVLPLLLITGAVAVGVSGGGGDNPPPGHNWTLPDLPASSLKKSRRTKTFTLKFGF